MDSSARFVDPMDLVEQHRETLDLVDHHPRPRWKRRHQIHEVRRVATELQVAGRVEQIDEERLGEDSPQPGRLAGSAGPEKDETLLRQPVDPLNRRAAIHGAGSRKGRR